MAGFEAKLASKYSSNELGVALESLMLKDEALLPGDNKRSLETLMNSRTLPLPSIATEPFEESQLPNCKAKSLVTLSNPNPECQTLGEAAKKDPRDILYTSLNGDRLPRASVSDLRSILRSVSASRSVLSSTSSNNLAHSLSGSCLTKSFPAEARDELKYPRQRRNSVCKDDHSKYDQIQKSISIAEEILGQINAAINGLQSIPAWKTQ